MMCRRVLSIAATLVVAGSTILAGAAAADTETTPHPAGVHRGSCPDVGDLVAPLGDVSSKLLVEGTATVTEPVDPSGAVIPVEASVTTIPIAYTDLLAAPHGIVVRQSADELTVSLLCGDIGGAGWARRTWPSVLAPSATRATRASRRCTTTLTAPPG